MDGVSQIACVVQRKELRRIQKLAESQPFYRHDVPPTLAAISKIEANVAGAEGTKGTRHASRRLGDSDSRACRHFDDEARLISIICGRRTGDYFKRLN